MSRPSQKKPSRGGGGGGGGGGGSSSSISNKSNTNSKASVARRRDPLASLKETDMLISKPLLPAEILAQVVDFLAIPDLMRFARVSRRMCEMVYDDSRWVRRLKLMGVWDDQEAKANGTSSSSTTTTTSITNSSRRRLSIIDRNNMVNGKGRPRKSVSLMMAMNDDDTGHDSNDTHDGFDAVQMAGPALSTLDNRRAALTALRRVRSIRGQARQEYGKVYRAVGPFYVDTLRQQDARKGLVFGTFDTPADRAQMLVQVRVLAQSDASPGYDWRERRIKEAIDLLDTAALLDFRQGYEYGDIVGQMRQAAHVMHILNGGASAVDLFLHDNRMIVNKASLGSAADCVDYSQGWSQLSLERVQAYFDRLAVAFAREAGVVRAVFPNPDEVLLQLLETTGQEVLMPFLTTLFDDAQARAGSLYLKIISGTFAATRHFIVDNCLGGGDAGAVERANAVVGRIYEPHLEAYLTQELEAFRLKADREIDQWNRSLAEQAASTESYLMSNVSSLNRRADKKDFLSSFRQVVMAPVNLLPGFGATTTTAAAATASKPTTAPKSRTSELDLSLTTAPRSRTSELDLSLTTRSSTPSLPPGAPTTELAAQAALMNARLESIRSLFSIEVALNLVHSAKSSIERVAQFTALGGDIGQSARAKCRAIFSLLVETVGTRHVKAGFDTAIERLEGYKVRDGAAAGGSSSSDETVQPTTQVAPLATFLELINVSDLIQQMLALFFESELVAPGIVSRDDFVDASVKDKKRFEAMLDERVATGLSRGIDVLMDEIEYVLATTQAPSDFNPDAAAARDMDIGPTATARRVVAMVAEHTGLLTGAADKALLDVFTAEVGLRLFTLLCKHIKRQRVSTAGALPLISDLALYAGHVAGFRNVDLNNYYAALREVAQIYLIAGAGAGTDAGSTSGSTAGSASSRDVAEMAAIIGDADRYRGIFTVEDVVEFAERRTDWLLVRAGVERRVLGEGCVAM